MVLINILSSKNSVFLQLFLQNRALITPQTRTQSLLKCFLGWEKIEIKLRRPRGLMGREEGKIATGRFRFNMAAREESSLSRDIKNALTKGELACQHRGCIIFEATSEYPAANFCVKFTKNYLHSVALASLWMQYTFIQTSFMARKQGPSWNTVITTVFPSSLPMRPCARLNLIPNLLSPQKTLK